MVVKQHYNDFPSGLKGNHKCSKLEPLKLSGPERALLKVELQVVLYGITEACNGCSVTAPCPPHSQRVFTLQAILGRL